MHGTIPVRKWLRGAVAAAILIIGGASAPATADEVEIGRETTVPPAISHAAIAHGHIPLPEVLALGRQLFEARFTTLDGAGRPGATAAEVPTRREIGDTPAFLRTSGPDANACAGCHIQALVGGSGDFSMNVFVAPQDLEFDFDTIAPDLSMERGTTSITGAGFLELLAREMTADLHALRAQALDQARASGAPVTVQLVTKDVGFGQLTALPDGFVDVSRVEGVHPDLIVKPFSQKAVVISLRQFSVGAFNMHHGIQPDERFGHRWTGDHDFDRDGVVGEMNDGLVTATTLFQAALPPPIQVMPDHPILAEATIRGEALFEQVGCAACHRPQLILDNPVFAEPGPYNPAGTLRDGDTDAIARVDLAALWGDWIDVLPDGRVAVRAFTDLRRHRIADPDTPHFANEMLTHNFVPRDQFRTAPLWGVGSTAPYGHRGDVTTLDSVIRHHGGDAADSRRAYETLPDRDRRSVIQFLQSLQIVPLEPDVSVDQAALGHR